MSINQIALPEELDLNQEGDLFKSSRYDVGYKVINYHGGWKKFEVVLDVDYSNGAHLQFNGWVKRSVGLKDLQDDLIRSPEFLLGVLFDEHFTITEGDFQMLSDEAKDLNIVLENFKLDDEEKIESGSIKLMEGTKVLKTLDLLDLVIGSEDRFLEAFTTSEDWDEFMTHLGLVEG